MNEFLLGWICGSLVTGLLTLLLHRLLNRVWR